VTPVPPIRPAVLEWLTEARTLGFLGPGDVLAHVEHAERFIAAVGPDFAGTALDLGTGAGVPGLLLAERWPDSDWILLDGKQRRMQPLTDTIAALGLADRVRVRCQRAEEAGQDVELREQLDLVVARSFGAPAVTAECGGAFVRVGGHVAISEPPPADPAGVAADGHERWPEAPLLTLGLRPVPSPTPWVQRLEKVASTPPDRPRRVGIPSKRPLF
jgi:16S rRNA (guanine527-N7)-methyltransferase